MCLKKVEKSYIRKLSLSTLELLKRSKELKDTEGKEVTNINTFIRKVIKEDIHNYSQQLIQEIF